MEESGHVDVVGEGGGQAQDTDHALGALHLQNTMHIQWIKQYDGSNFEDFIDTTYDLYLNYMYVPTNL